MAGIVATGVTEVDAADKGNVRGGPGPMAHHHELLMVGAPEAHALVEQDLASGRVDHHSEVAILLGAEPQAVRVRPPEEPFDAHPTTNRGGEDRSDLRLRAFAKALVGVAPPVGEQQLVAGAELSDGLQQAVEVRRAVHQRLDPVAGRPRRPVRMPPIEPGEFVAALGAREKPALEGACRSFAGPDHSVQIKDRRPLGSSGGVGVLWRLFSIQAHIQPAGDSVRLTLGGPRCTSTFVHI